MSGYLRGLFDYLKARNAPLEPVLDVMNLTEREALEPDRRIENSLQNEIFDVAERVTGDVDVGLHAGEATHLMHFGIAGMLAMTCSTGRELLDIHTRYSGLLSTGATMRYFLDGEELVGEATFAPGEEPLTRHTLEYTLASHPTLTRLMTGMPFAPLRLDVPYSEPADCTEQQRVFGCPVRYGCEHERIYMLAALLDIPLVVGDSGSRAMLEIEAHRRLDTVRTPLVDQDPDMASLKQFVAAELRGGPSSVEQTAAAARHVRAHAAASPRVAAAQLPRPSGRRSTRPGEKVHGRQGPLASGRRLSPRLLRSERVPSRLSALVLYDARRVPFANNFA